MFRSTGTAVRRAGEREDVVGSVWSLFGRQRRNRVHFHTFHFLSDCCGSCTREQGTNLEDCQDPMSHNRQRLCSSLFQLAWLCPGGLLLCDGAGSPWKSAPRVDQWDVPCEPMHQRPKVQGAQVSSCQCDTRAFGTTVVYQLHSLRLKQHSLHHPTSIITRFIASPLTLWFGRDVRTVPALVNFRHGSTGFSTIAIRLLLLIKQRDIPEYSDATSLRTIPSFRYNRSERVEFGLS